jgi:hypothetical protein
MINSRKLVLGNIYRPPRNNIDNYNTFINDLNLILSNFQRSKCDVAIAGDFNIDLLKIQDRQIFHDYFDTFISNGFIPKIVLPTRITNQSSTLIDNVYVKLSNDLSDTTAGILTHQISDHQPYFISLDYIKTNNTRVPGKRQIQLLPNDRATIANLKCEIRNAEILNKLDKSTAADPNNNYDLMNDCILKAIDKHLQTKTVNYNKHRHKKEQWMTTGILNSIKHRDKLYTKLHNTPNNSHEYENTKINLQTYNRILKQNIRNAKKIYFQQCFNRYKNDIKKDMEYN